MSRILEFLREVWPPAFGLAVSTLLYFEFVAWKDRRVGMVLRGNRSDLRYLLSWTETWFYGVMATNYLLFDGRPLATYMRIGVWFVYLPMLMGFADWFWMRRRNRVGPKARNLSGGALFDGVKALRLRAGLSADFRVYITPDGFDDEPERARNPARVLVPQRLIEWMSRAEIDALLAFDMVRRERIQPRRRAYWTALGCGTAVWTVLWFLNVGSQGRWVTFLILLKATLIATRTLLPRMARAAGPGPIEASGNPEAFCSAMAELTRLDGGVVTARLAEEIGQMAGVAPERALALQGQARPALNRYSSCGGAEYSQFRRQAGGRVAGWGDGSSDATPLPPRRNQSVW